MASPEPQNFPSRGEAGHLVGGGAAVDKRGRKGEQPPTSRGCLEELEQTAHHGTPTDLREGRAPTSRGHQGDFWGGGSPQSTEYPLNRAEGEHPQHGGLRGFKLSVHLVLIQQGVAVFICCCEVPLQPFLVQMNGLRLDLSSLIVLSGPRLDWCHGGISGGIRDREIRDQSQANHKSHKS